MAALKSVTPESGEAVLEVSEEESRLLAETAAKGIATYLRIDRKQA